MLKRVAWGVVSIPLALSILVSAVIWGVTTPTGFLWLAKQATPLSKGRLVLEGVEGHLGASVHIAKLIYKSDRQRITLQQVQLDWKPHSLWHRLVEIDLLAAQHARVEILMKDPTPPVYPRSLRLPLELRVAAWTVGQLDMIDSGQTRSFNTLRGEVDGRGDRFDLVAAAHTPWAEVVGQFDIHKDAPFKVRGAFNVVRRTPVPMEAKLELAGELAAIDFKLDAGAEGMSLMAAGQAAPFAPIRLLRLVLSGQGIDPSQWAADAPHARLAFSGVFEGQPGEQLVGTFSLTNQLPGRLDQQRLPLANLTAAVVGGIDAAQFSAVKIDLDKAGRFAGDGQWRDGRFNLVLTSPRLNLAGIHRALHPTHIRTALTLAGDAAQQTLSADIAETWAQGSFKLSHADAVLRLHDARFSGQAGQLTASGSLQLDTARAFTAQFNARNINPSRVGKFPRGRLNARGTVRGALLPALNVQAQFVLPPGQLEGRPVQGYGKFRFAPAHLTDTDIKLDVAGNRVLLKGAWGRQGDRLVWDIHAPALARLNLGMAGQLTSTGSIRGEPRQPQIEAVLNARGLRLPGEIVADAINLQLDLQAISNGVFNGKLETRGVQWAGRRISLARAKVQGTRNAHTLSLDAQLAEGRIQMALVGGFDARYLWHGQLNQFQAQGKWPVALNAPAGLVLGQDQQHVRNLNLSVAGGKISGVQLSRQGSQITTQGALTNLPLAPLLVLLKKPPPLTTDLRVNGDWNLRLGKTFDGQARLIRHSGDVRLTDPAVLLGLTQLDLKLQAVASRVTARLEVNTREAGQGRAEGSGRVERAGAGFILPRSAPLTWTATFNVPNLRLLKPFIPVGMRLDSRVAAQLAGSGSLAAPRINGQIDASRIRFTLPEEGVSITDGSVKLLLSDDRVRVQQGELIGLNGRIVVSGEAQLKNPQAGLTLTFEQFSATSRSDRQVVVSGITQLNLDPKRLELTGNLRVDRARLQMPAESKPSLSSDVVILGRPPREKPASQRYPLALDLTLKLGDDFLFKGAGLDARLGGQLRVFTLNQVLRGEGTIQVEEGRYAAYAQTLNIERGVLRFVGPINNPGLDVLAVRKTPSVKAGVQVSGTVQRPIVKLYSDPPLPDTEKLAWLVLGHGLENSGQQEFVLMQVAAAALLSQSESVNFQSKLADTLGIDSFDLRAGDGATLSSSVVSVGKRLSSRATLSFEQSLDGLSQVVKMLYQLTPNVRLEAQAGEQSSFDVLYSKEYD